MSELVGFNASGTVFTISRTSIEKFPDTFLARIVDKTQGIGLKCDSNGNIFLDIDPEYFRIVLDFYRFSKLFIDDTINKDRLWTIIDYFQLPLERYTAHTITKSILVTPNYWRPLDRSLIDFISLHHVIYCLQSGKVFNHKDSCECYLYDIHLDRMYVHNTKATQDTLIKVDFQDGTKRVYRDLRIGPKTRDTTFDLLIGPGKISLFDFSIILITPRHIPEVTFQISFVFDTETDYTLPAPCPIPHFIRF